LAKGALIMKNKIAIYTILILIFVIFAEKVTFQILFFAGLTAHIVLKVNQKSYSYELVKPKTIIPWSKFILILIYEIIIANFQVAAIALNPKMDIDPKIVMHKSELKDDLLLTILANSITLTPGTMTVDIKDNNLKIHCLNDSYKKALIDNKLEKMLLHIEGEANG